MDFGLIATANTTITAENGSFTLKSGERFTPPGQVDIWNPYPPSLELDRIVDGWPEALRCGAFRVQVNTQEHSLYGIALFPYHPAEATGPSAFNYRIEIPKQRVEQAMNGNVSVVYEILKVRREAPGWVLWLSDKPFPNVP